MSHARSRTSASCLVGVLVSLLVLGHACELPAFTDPMAPAAASSHDHGADHHPDESQIACDAVSATSPTHSQAGPSLVERRALAVFRPSPVRPDYGAVSAPARPPSRPPLFLLHASFLI